jgi:hypothetical protein
LIPFQIRQTFFLPSLSFLFILAHFCLQPNQSKSAGALHFFGLVRLRRAHLLFPLQQPSATPRPSSAAGPLPPLPRLQRLTLGARLSSPTPRSWPSRTRARVRLRTAPAVRMPPRAWPARQDGASTYLSLSPPLHHGMRNPSRPKNPRAEPAETLGRRRCRSVKDRYGELERGGSEWEPIKILLKGDRGSNKMNTTSNTHLRLNYLSWSRPRSHWSATDPRNQQTTFRAKTHKHAHQKLARLAACATPVRPMACAGQTGDTGQTGGQSRSGRWPQQPHNKCSREPQ